MLKTKTAERLVIPLLAGLLHCSSERAQPSTPREATVSAEPAAGSSAEPTPYPQARWRLSPRIDLNNVMLWVSQILIRHADSDRQVTASQLDWYLDDPPQRNRAAALAMANQIAADLVAQPARFAEIARARSDDAVSAASGGSLGGLRACDLLLVPEVLDALAVLKPGEISRVVETPHGFHIFQRHGVSPVGQVAGRHIVIGHRDAPTLGLMSARAGSRSRSEALAIAREIQRSATAEPQLFPELVQSYSEHPDRVARGDLGSWSLREPSPHARGVETLQHLVLGAISSPVETPYGIEILQRMPEVPRPEYAMEAIQIPYSPQNPRSLQEAQDALRQLSTQISEAPGLFDEFRHRYCCVEAERWFQGRDDAGLSSAMSQLRINEIGMKPVQGYVALVLPRRVDPASVPVPPVAFELPTPDHLVLDWVLQHVAPDRIVQELVSITQGRDLGLEPRQTQLLRALASAEGTAASPQGLVPQIRELVGTEGSTPLRALIEQRFTELVLGATIVRPNPG